MLVDALSSHPEIDVIHEFQGDEVEYRNNPQILSNYFKEWMTGMPIIHVYREDAIAGARSMLLMSYTFPDGVVHLPVDEVLALAERRKKWDKEFRDMADYSVSYESFGEDVTELPQDFTDRCCELVGLESTVLKTNTKKGYKLILRNQDDIRCLHA
jgi:hypothetical protein